ncbi:MAG TPA: hypothetical protein H9837_08715 [Candidatus Brachybacterium merdigallinarum]|nr:hypothetical protein [Candidatus Brachybacterium merdigallinarum]
MIIWRGWGVLAFVYIAVLAMLLGGALGAGALQSSAAAGPLAGLGIILGGVLTALHGYYLNIMGPKKRAAQWEEAERPRLESAAASGNLVVGNVQPSSRAEADQMIESVLADGRRVIGKHGPHSLFWIPMEAVGILAIIGGLAVVVITTIGALGG